MTDKGTASAGQHSEDVLWHSSSVLLGGPLVWGGIGYLASRLTGWEWLFPVGIVLGFVGSFVITYVRYFAAEPAGPPGRSWSGSSSATGDGRSRRGADRGPRGT